MGSFLALAVGLLNLIGLLVMALGFVSLLFLPSSIEIGLPSDSLELLKAKANLELALEH